MVPGQCENRYIGEGGSIILTSVKLLEAVDQERQGTTATAFGQRAAASEQFYTHTTQSHDLYTTGTFYNVHVHVLPKTDNNPS